MSLPALHQMRAKRLEDATQGRGYGTPTAIVTPAARSLQLLGAPVALTGDPCGFLAMLSVYEKGGSTYIQRGFLEGTEITGTGRVHLSAGDRVYVRATVQRQDTIWFTSMGDDPVTYRYFTGAYNIVSAEILIVPDSAAAPADVFSGVGDTSAIIHKLIYSVPASGVLPPAGSFGRWLRLSQGELLF